jgi:hypothetical protein
VDLFRIKLRKMRGVYDKTRVAKAIT